jgi:hypothetical protein
MSAPGVPGEAASEFGLLDHFIDKANTMCYNEDRAFPHSNVFAEDERLLLRSTDDEMLLLKVPFVGDGVKIQSLVVDAPHSDERPVVLKLFINKAGLDFSVVEDLEPVQTLKIAPEDLGSAIRLKYVRFQRVTSLWVYIDENAGA